MAPTFKKRLQKGQCRGKASAGLLKRLTKSAVAARVSSIWNRDRLTVRTEKTDQVQNFVRSMFRGGSQPIWPLKLPTRTDGAFGGQVSTETSQSSQKEQVQKLYLNLDTIYKKIQNQASLRLKFDLAVQLLFESREAKEAGLVMKPLPEKFLDDTDHFEQEACDILYGIFKYSLGQSDGEPARFNKKHVDQVMEDMFGSLDDDSRELSTREDSLDAKILFSLYLARKVWCPVPWRSFSSAMDGFFSRVCSNRQQERPVDEDALQTATLIFDLITTYGPKPDEFRNVEPNSDSACIELSKACGGKREAQYCSSKSPAGFSYVVPKAIYTGGKIRVITISSFESSKYLWINKWLGACFRRLECSIFGGEVTEWWKRQEGRFAAGVGEQYVSGDLEAATDNFDSRITDFLIDRLCNKLNLGEQAATEIKQFTTQCVFKHGMDYLVQLCGNMMGSEVSFPFLCIFSLTAYICKNDPLRDKLFGLLRKGKKGKKEAYALLSKLRLGVNGDDVVFPAKEFQFWLDGVAAIGGVVSKGKSLVNPFFFTVNSELWSSDGKQFCARPTFLTAINDGRKYFISPTRELLEYERSDLFVDRTVFDIERRLKLNIPVRWGGLGLVKKWDPYQNALAKLKSEHDRLVAKKSTKKGSARAMEEYARIREELKQYGPKLAVKLSKDARSAYQRVYTSKAASWSEKTKSRYPDRIYDLARITAEGWATRKTLKAEWETLMCLGQNAIMELPVGLVKVYNAQPLDAVLYKTLLPRTFAPVAFADESVYMNSLMTASYRPVPGIAERPRNQPLPFLGYSESFLKKKEERRERMDRQLFGPDEIFYSNCKKAHYQ